MTDSSKGKLVRDLALYTAARLGLIAVVAAAIFFGAMLFGVQVPLLVAMVFALVVAFPLSIVLFKSLRIRVNEDIAAVDEQRRIARADLDARLRGE
jgi:fatty acid desaturase